MPNVGPELEPLELGLILKKLKPTVGEPDIHRGAHYCSSNASSSLVGYRLKMLRDLHIGAVAPGYFLPKGQGEAALLLLCLLF